MNSRPLVQVPFILDSSARKYNFLIIKALIVLHVREMFFTMISPLRRKIRHFVLFVLMLGVSLARGWEELPDYSGPSKKSAWSDSVNGLRARFIVFSPRQKGDANCRVLIEFENRVNVVGQRRIRFSPDNLEIHVSDAEGKKLSPLTNLAHDGSHIFWKPIELPYEGKIQFPITVPFGQIIPKLGFRLLDLGTLTVWEIPLSGEYYLSGVFSVKREIRDSPITDWAGSITIPKVSLVH
jgi:hypothetical protein